MMEIMELPVNKEEIVKAEVIQVEKAKEVDVEIPEEEEE